MWGKVWKCVNTYFKVGESKQNSNFSVQKYEK